MFIDDLINAIKEKNNPSIVGIDTKLEYVPPFIKESAFLKYGYTLKAAAEAIYSFNKMLINSICDIVPAIKPQAAYYEMYGIDGVKTLYKTIKYAKQNGLLVILDCKRNDIGSTAESYSSAYIGRTRVEGAEIRAFETDAITVNPYLGIDGIKPFLKDCSQYGTGVFILVKTSNKSSGQFQDLITVEGTKIYELVASFVNEIACAEIGKYGYSSIGAVVGATYPEEAERLRKIMLNSYFLVPGYGEQGGTANDIKNFFNEDGLGAIINSSRKIMLAYKNERWKSEFSEKTFYLASRAEALLMKNEINNMLNNRK